MTSTLVIMSHWTLNQDKTFTFFDNKKIKLFSTDKIKEFKYLDSDKTYKMYEHRIPLSGKLIKAHGFDGYQYEHQKFTIIVAFGRRMKEGKNYVQDINELFVMMNLKEPELKIEVDDLSEN